MTCVVVCGMLHIIAKGLVLISKSNSDRFPIKLFKANSLTLIWNVLSKPIDLAIFGCN